MSLSFCLQYFAREKERILREMEERGVELAKLLHEFQVRPSSQPIPFSDLLLSKPMSTPPSIARLRHQDSL